MNAICPGFVPGTRVARHWHPFANFLHEKVLPYFVWLLQIALDPNVHKPEISGAAIAMLAIGEEMKGVSGKYFEGEEVSGGEGVRLKECRSSKDSYDKAKQEDLWEWTARVLGRDDNERREFEMLA